MKSTNPPPPRKKDNLNPSSFSEHSWNWFCNWHSCKKSCSASCCFECLERGEWSCMFTQAHRFTPCRPHNTRHTLLWGLMQSIHHHYWTWWESCARSLEKIAFIHMWSVKRTLKLSCSLTRELWMSEKPQQLHHGCISLPMEADWRTIPWIFETASPPGTFLPQGACADLLSCEPAKCTMPKYHCIAASQISMENEMSTKNFAHPM